MYQLTKAAILLKRRLKRRFESKETERSSLYSKNINKFKIFSPKTLHALIIREKFESYNIKPFSKRMFGAVLFADISGFTRLSAKLDSEELKFHINLYFSLLLGVVFKYHGDVLKFCGDAVIVMWPIDENSSTDIKCAAVELAIKCAIQLLKICGHYDKNMTNDRPSVSLRLHCGIGCGFIHSMCLGAGERWEFLISGTPLKQVGIATAEAGLGEVCVSQEVYNLLPDSFNVEKMPSGSYKIRGIHNNSNARIDTSPSQSLLLHATSSLSKDLESSGDALGKLNITTSRRASTTSVSNIRSETVSEHAEWSGSTVRAIALTKGLTNKLLSSKHKYTSNENLKQLQLKEQQQQSQLQKEREKEKELREKDEKEQQQQQQQQIQSIVQSTLQQSPPHTSNSSHRGSGPQRRSLALAAAQMAALWAANSSNDSSRVRGRSASVVPIHEEEFDISKYSQVISYLDPTLASISSLTPLASLDNNKFDDLEEQTKPRTFSKLVRYFVPESARDAIEQNRLSYLAELRVVVTMFIEVLDLDIDFLQGAIDRPQFVISTVLSCLTRYGGVLRQYVVDDKGCVLIVAFGLSGSSHEDNSVRAIETALRIRHILNSSDINCRFGITSGKVFCGLVGSSDRCEYAMMGSSVNLAARFMSHAPINDMIVSQEIYTESAHEFEYLHLPKMHAKGYDKPVPAYSPIKRIVVHHLKVNDNDNKTNDSKDSITFVGRQNELQILQNGYTLYKMTPTSSQHMYCLNGPAGYGKTWLLNKFIKDISSDSFIKNIYSLVADEYHSTTKYFCLRQLFDQILRNDLSKYSTVKEIKNLSKKYSSQNSNSTDLTSTKYRKMITFSHSVICGIGGEEDRSEYTEMLTKWFEYNCPKLRIKDLNIGREIYENTTKLQQPPPPQQQQQPSDSNLIHEESSTHIISESLTKNTLVIDVLSCLDNILPIESNYSPAISSMSNWARMKLSHHVILKVLEKAIISKGVILTIENLHWCDSASLDIIHHLFNHCKAGYLITTVRSLSQEKDNQEGNSSSRLTRSGKHKIGTVNIVPKINHVNKQLCRSAQMLIKMSNKCQLELFTTNEIQEMLETFMSQRLLQSYPDLLTIESLQKIQKRTGGTPYLISSLLVSLKDSLINGNFGGIESLPTGEQNIIVNRFDKLNSTEQLILKVASVIGDTFAYDFLAQVLKNMGDGVASAAIGLDATLQKLQSSSLIIQSNDSTGPSFVSRYSLDKIESCGSDENEINSNQFPILYYQFTARNIKECIYNLMLQSQRESVHSIIGRLLEKQYGTLPELYFLDIAKHFYSSNNLQKKIMYLEESLRRAQYDNEVDLMKESLHQLLTLTTGYESDGIIQNCCTANIKPKGLIKPLNISLVSVATRHIITSKNIQHFTKELKWDDPIVAQWLTSKNLRSHITLLEGVNQTQSERAMTDPFAAIHHDKDSSISITEKALQLISNKSPVNNRTVHIPMRMLTIQNVLCWLSQLALVHFRVGNFKYCNNLGIIFLSEIGIQLPNPQDYFISITNISYKLKMFLRSFRSIKYIYNLDYIRYGVKTMLSLIQIHLLKGQTAPADEYLRLIEYISHENQFSSELYEYQILYQFISFLKGKRIDDDDDEMLQVNNNSVDLSQENLYTPSSIGLNYLLKSVIELSYGNVEKSLLLGHKSLIMFEKSEIPLLVYLGLVVRGWNHLFSCKFDDSLQIASDASLFASISHGIPLLLHKWSAELFILTKILKNDYSNARCEWEKLRPLTRRDLHSATSCSLLSFLSVSEENYFEIIPYCRYACIRLSEKQITSPMNAVFLFLAGYSALRIIEYCKMEINLEFSKLTNQAYERLNIDRFKTFQSELNKNNKITDYNYRSTINLLIPCVNIVLEALNSNEIAIPVLQLFSYTLYTMKKRIFTLSTNISSEISTKLKYFSKYDSFSFGMYFAHFEASLYYSSKDSLQSHQEAFQLYDIAKKYFHLSSNINISREVSFASQNLHKLTSENQVEGQYFLNSIHMSSNNYDTYMRNSISRAGSGNIAVNSNGDVTSLQQLQQIQRLQQRQKQQQQQQNQNQDQQQQQQQSPQKQSYQQNQEQQNQTILQLSIQHPDDLYPSNKSEHQEEKESFNDILSLLSQDLNSERKKGIKKETIKTPEELILSPIE